MHEKNLKDYLAGEAEDYQSLADHDKVYHKGGYKEGDACKVREALKKSDDPDRMQQKADIFGERTKTRNETVGALGKLFGGNVKFDENDRGDDGMVGFTIDNPKHTRWGEQYYVGELADEGYKAIVNISGWTDKTVSGYIRKFTPNEMFERIKAQKPKWNRDGDYKVDGTYYDSDEEAMEAWQKAMKKYGGQVKSGVSSSKAEDAAPVKRYLEMCSVQDGDTVSSLKQDLAEHKKHCVAQPGNCPKEKELKAEIEKVEAPKDQADKISSDQKYDKEYKESLRYAKKLCDREIERLLEDLRYDIFEDNKKSFFKAHGIPYREIDYYDEGAEFWDDIINVAEKDPTYCAYRDELERRERG